ncbi:MAG: bacterial Ig-like domain-containing protein [Treponema sp.]|nr:bacterial Ig-like domain-containing protein [Treponema sp.]
MKKSKLFLTILLCLTALSLISCTSPVASSVTSGTDTGTSVTGTTTTPATPSVTLSSIAVSGSLASALYYVGDSVNTSGLTVTATYSDGSTKSVTCFTASAFNGVNLGTEQTITISYTEGSVTKTATVNGTFYVAAAGAKPTESPVLLSDYTGTLTGGIYYKFGDFPQTISALTGDGAYTAEPVYKGWYLGSDGYFYAKCTENSSSSSYTYSNGTTVAFSSANSQKYFKVEPIKWRVLNPSASENKILVAESILTANIPYYGSTSDRTLDETTIYANNYKYSNIRAYLNGTKNQFVTDGGTATVYDVDWTGKGFLQTAFTSSAQSLIATTTVDNSAASTNPASNASLWNNGTNAYACDNTSDKIFLLSEKEATTESYDFPEYNEYGIGNSRIRVTTDYAKANYAYQYTIAGYGGGWWLRSPDYDNSYNARFIYDAGDSSNAYYVNIDYCGVVPALSISIGN